ncbi:hypothetical protein C8R44DRAFT_731951 [Mycena epipterygia]|nr:hypothetical protein C8R44DRAFT_731951 [Mycena epipterygia]
MIRISTLVFLACVLALSSAVPTVNLELTAGPSLVVNTRPAARAIAGSRSVGASESLQKRNEGSIIFRRRNHPRGRKTALDNQRGRMRKLLIFHAIGVFDQDSGSCKLQLAPSLNIAQYSEQRACSEAAREGCDWASRPLLVPGRSTEFIDRMVQGCIAITLRSRGLYSPQYRLVSVANEGRREKKMPVIRPIPSLDTQHVGSALSTSQVMSVSSSASFFFA